MAEYMFLFRASDEVQAKLKESPGESQAHTEKWVQWMGALTEQGKFMGAQPLKIEGKVVNGAAKMVTDGPFIEGKEMVGGYLICKAESLDEAVELSKGCPVLEYGGTVEVREIGEVSSCGS